MPDQDSTRHAQRALPRLPVIRDPPTSAGPSAFVLSFSGLPANNAGPQQTSWGKTLRFRRDHVANTPPGPTGTGHRCWRPAHPPKGRLTALHSRSQPRHTYGFLQTRPHGSPAAQTAAWDRPVNSGPRPCLIDVGFPLSGPQDRTSTSDLKRHAQHTATRYALRSTRHRQNPQSEKINYTQQPTRSGATSSRRAGATANRRAHQATGQQWT